MIDTASRALLSLGCFVAVGSLLMLPLTGAGTGERIVSQLALVLGLGIVAGAIVARLIHRRRLRNDAMTDLIDDMVVTTKENP